MNRQGFSIRQEEHHDGFSVVVAGELDLIGVPELEASVGSLCETGTAEIELDLRGVTFIDSSGLRAILVCKEICERHGIDLYVVPSESRAPRRLFEITDLADRVPWRTARQHVRD